MTSPASASGKSDQHHHAATAFRRHGGFTLIEMLVVIGIILVLAGVLLPSLAKAYRSAQRTAMAADLNAISVALEAYRKDFKDYPRVVKDATLTTVDATHPNPMLGAQMLAFALMGPAAETEAGAIAGKRPVQDGYNGFGFRTQRTPNMVQGKTYPPYLASDQFKCMDPMDETTSAGGGPVTNNNPDHALRFCLLDRNNRPILYFPASPAHPNVKMTGGTPAPYADSAIASSLAPLASEASLYDLDDNLQWFGDDPTAYASIPIASGADAKIALKRIRVLLGETVNPNGVIENGEAAVDLPFLLWSAGPDERFGPADLSTGTGLLGSDQRIISKCDDVTNFRP